VIAPDRRLRGRDVRVDLGTLRVRDDSERRDQDAANAQSNLQSAQSNLQSAISNLQSHDGVAV
jgi:hypothetical protein